MEAHADPRVSVVLVIYNRVPILSVTIDSILEQTFTDFELLLCDDCSTDDSGNICKTYAEKDERVRYLPSARNLGMPGNMNRGIEAALGKYVATLHDGDLYEPRMLEAWSSALDACEKAAFVFNAYLYESPRGKECLEVLDLPACGAGAIILERYFFRRLRLNSPVFGTVMARRAAYAAAAYFDPRFGALADVDMWMRLAEDHHVAYVPEPLIALPSKQRVPTNLRTTLSEKQRWLEVMYLEARRRHFPPGVRRNIELARHWCYVWARTRWCPSSSA